MAINFPNNPAVNDTFTVGGTKFTFTGVKWETGAVVDLSSDTTPTLGGDLDGGAKNINNVGVITATALHGNASALTGLTGASANTYGNGTAVPEITVDANGRITSISNVLISADAGGGTNVYIKDGGSVVGTAGTIDFGNGLSVSNVSAGIVTVTAAIAGINTSGTSEFTHLNVSGLSTFANTVTTGTISTSTAGGAGSNLSGDGRLTLQFPSGGGGGVGMFSVYLGTSKNIELFSGGSATFAGDITAASFNGNLDASQLSSGTIPDARFPATLPAASGANLTDLPGMSTSSKTGAYTLVAGDNNSLIRTNSNITVPASVFSIADATTIYNNSSSSISIVQGGSVTLRLAGSNTTGTRTLAQRGVCTVMCVGTNEFIITGSGLA